MKISDIAKAGIPHRLFVGETVVYGRYAARVTFNRGATNINNMFATVYRSVSGSPLTDKHLESIFHGEVKDAARILTNVVNEVV